MKPWAWGLVLGASLVVGAYLAGRLQERAALATARARDAAVLAAREDSVAKAGQAARDSLRRVIMARDSALAQHQAAAEVLRGEADAHRRRDRELQAALAHAGSDSARVVVLSAQVLALRGEAATLRAAGVQDSLTIADLQDQRRSDHALHQQLADSAAARYAAVRAALLTAQDSIRALARKGKPWLGFLPPPACVVGYGAIPTAGHGAGAMCGIRIRL